MRISANRSLRSSESCDRNAKRRTGNVIQSRFVTEQDGRGIASVFTADTKLETCTGRAAAFDGEFYQFSNTLRVQGYKRVSRNQFLLQIFGEKSTGVVAAHTQCCLCEIVRPEQKKFCSIRNIPRHKGGARQLDHCSDEISGNCSPLIAN